jgi:hypothetical protein
MKLIPTISTAGWTVVADQVFNDGYDDSAWTYRCDPAEAAEIVARVIDGRLLQAQRRVAPGRYELVVRLPRYAPKIEPPKAKILIFERLHGRQAPL